MVEEGLSDEAARRQVFMVDRHGLITEGMSGLQDFQRCLAQNKADLADWSCEGEWATLDEVAARARPTILIGVSGQPGLFTESVIQSMTKNSEAPIIFPLSNPVSRAEATPENIIRWTNGKAIIATGSPFQPVHVVFDAGRGELYAVIASPHGPPGATGADSSWQLEVAGLLKPAVWRDSLPQGAAVTGPGLGLADPLLTELPSVRPDLWIASPADRQPTASTVAQLGLAAAGRNETLDAAAVVPIYLRASYAEEKKG